MKFYGILQGTIHSTGILEGLAHISLGDRMKHFVSNREGGFNAIVLYMNPFQC